MLQIDIYMSTDNSSDSPGHYLSDEEAPISTYPVADHHGPKTARETIYLAFQSLGAVYGDIGTSPLYTLNSVFATTPNEEDIMGACSCIFWGLTLVVLIKYCIIVFIFGPNGGEGGIVAIYAKLARELNIAPVGVDFDKDSLDMLSKSETQSSWMNNRRSRENYGWFKKLAWNLFKYIPIIACLCGSAFLMSDGMLTPVQSVLSAIAGLEQPAPYMKHYVVLISCFILAFLFLGQRVGSAKLAMVFSPIVFIWFVMLFVIGVINIAKKPAILKATNPKYAFDYLLRGGIDNMGNVILALTGAEAMFADVGHFSPNAIRLAVITCVYPPLWMAYFGQGAALLVEPSIMPNVFYLSIPGGIGGGLYWFMFVLAILSTIIASQAIILGVFSVSRQLMALECMPQFPVCHMSAKIEGKVYIPMLNYIFMVACILCAIGFQNSNNTAAAYGLCVSLDFFITTIMIAFSMYFCHKLHWFWSVFMVASFGLMDMCFVAAEVKKVPSGAWFPLVMSAVFVSIMLLWMYGNQMRIQYEFDHRVNIKKLFTSPTCPNVQTFSVAHPGQLRVFEGQRVESEIVEHDLSEKSMDIEPADEKKHQLTYRGTEYPSEKVNFQVSDSDSTHTPLLDRDSISTRRYPGLVIFYSNLKFTLRSPNTVPAMLKTFIDSFPTLADHVVLLAINIATIPKVPREDRISIVPVPSVPGLFRAVVTFGFMESAKMTQELEDDVAAKVGYKSNSGSDGEDNLAPRKVVHVFNKQFCYGYAYDKDNYMHSNAFSRFFIFCTIWGRKQLIDWIYGPFEYFFNASDKLVKILVTDPTSTPISVTTAAYI
ncbi:High affinity potassium transporter [Yarrowia sp. C11]|nr:High affinity potassium transporter [Yarrowia sp. E02]KAG5373424.1 High affinity potassium transporter [Yarrowia sp. C11]